MPKPERKAEAEEPADAARAVRTQTAHAEEHQSRAATTEASRAQAEELSSGVARTEATRAQAPSAGPSHRLLRRHVHEALTNRSDRELQRVLQERYYSFPARQRLPRHLLIERAIRFLDLTHLRLEARLAIIYLANSGWNYPIAVQRYMRERYDDDSDSDEDERPAESKGPEAEVPTVGLEPSPDDLLSFEEPRPLEEFTIKDICPCNLDGHKCMLPRRCRFIKKAICTTWVRSTHPVYLISADTNSRSRTATVTARSTCLQTANRSAMAGLACMEDGLVAAMGTIPRPTRGEASRQRSMLLIIVAGREGNQAIPEPRAWTQIQVSRTPFPFFSTTHLAQRLLGPRTTVSSNNSLPHGLTQPGTSKTATPTRS